MIFFSGSDTAKSDDTIYLKWSRSAVKLLILIPNSCSSRINWRKEVLGNSIIVLLLIVTAVFAYG